MIDRSAIRSKLQQELDRLRSRAGRIDDHQHNRDREVPTDWEELATFRENDEVVDALDDMTRGEIARIELALRRMDEGTWGTCVSCEKAIGARRLEVMPTHSLCLECQTRREQKTE
jgi:RNA polymerase-binding transcription factor DksA